VEEQDGEEHDVSATADEQFRGWATAQRPGMRRTAFLLCGDWFLADDLVQDALVRIFDAWPRLAGAPDLTRYSRRVLVNLYLDHRRRPSRREQPTDTVPDTAASQFEDPGSRELLLDALSRVPKGQRAVLVLRFFEDFSVEQTANALSTSTGNVKSQTSRGLVALRQALTKLGMTDAFDLQEQP
jgi:RNA polymerase sigma-70 factor (sigma-E family)